MTSLRSRQGVLAALIGLVLAIGMLGSVFAQSTTDLSSLDGKVVADGSSTLGPLTEAVAEEFGKEATGVDVTVDISGTGGGFKRFCEGETDVQNASRPIKDEEAAVCAENGVDWYAFEVAYDGITIVVNEQNTFLTCMNVESLKLLWQKDSPATSWNELNPEFPDDTINLYGAGTDSGTYDYFNEAILGKDEAGDVITGREDYSPSEDDNATVAGVAGDENALGFFGFSYYEANQDKLNAVAIDNGAGCITPSAETIRDGSYAPLSRPLILYVSASALERAEVQEFARYYIANAKALAADSGFVSSPDDVYTADATRVEAIVAGGATPDSQATPTP